MTKSSDLFYVAYHAASLCLHVKQMHIVLFIHSVPLEIRFVGNTPRVTGDTVRVQFTTNRPAASVRCDIDRVGRQDCKFQLYVH